VEGKVLSLFEPTRSDSQGKAHKPNEFGRLVRIDEVENGIVSAYQVLTGTRPIPHPGCRPSNNIKCASGARRRWPGRSRFFFPPTRTSVGAKSRE